MPRLLKHMRGTLPRNMSTGSFCTVQINTKPQAASNWRWISDTVFQRLIAQSSCEKWRQWFCSWNWKECRWQTFILAP